MIAPSKAWLILGRTASLAVGGVMAFLLLAGIGKAADLPGFHSELAAWDIIPTRVSVVVALMVPALEIAISIAWFFNMNRRRAELAALAIVFGFTIAYLAQAWVAEPPNCSCLGLWSRYHLAQTAMENVVARNIGLIVILSVAHGIARLNSRD